MSLPYQNGKQPAKSIAQGPELRSLSGNLQGNQKMVPSQLNTWQLITSQLNTDNWTHINIMAFILLIWKFSFKLHNISLCSVVMCSFVWLPNKHSTCQLHVLSEFEPTTSGTQDRWPNQSATETPHLNDLVFIPKLYFLCIEVFSNFSCIEVFSNFPCIEVFSHLTQKVISSSISINKPMSAA